MMMNFSGIMVGVFPLEIFLMSLSGIFYIFCAAFLWKPYRKEGNELIGALFFFSCLSSSKYVLYGSRNVYSQYSVQQYR